MTGLVTLSAGRLVVPRANERCFVPQCVWPRRPAVNTPYGAGWICKVKHVERKHWGLCLQHEDDGRTDTLKLSTFRRHCALVVPDNAALCEPWVRLDADALSVLLAACDLATLLAFEATHRGALLAVRIFWQHHHWTHTELAHGATRAAAMGGDFVAVSGQVIRMTPGTPDHFLSVWSCGTLVRCHHLPRVATTVAIDAATGAIAWSCATVAMRAPIHVTETIDGKAHAFRPCFATVLAWTERHALLVGERRRLVEWRPGGVEKVLLRRDAPTAAATSLAACGCMALIGWDDGSVHAAHAPHAPLLHMCPCHAGYALRGPCGSATRAVALSGEVAAAAFRSFVDVWCRSAHRLRVGACVTALCLHVDWLLVGVGAEGRLELWEPCESRRVGTLAGEGGAITSLGMAVDGSVVGSFAQTGDSMVVRSSRPPMPL